MFFYLSVQLCIYNSNSANWSSPLMCREETPHWLPLHTVHTFSNAHKFPWTTVTKTSGFGSPTTAVMCGSVSTSRRETYRRVCRRPLSFPHMDNDHTHNGKHSCVRKRVCVTQDISSWKRTMGRLKQRKKENSYCWGLHNRVESGRSSLEALTGGGRWE